MHRPPVDSTREGEDPRFDGATGLRVADHGYSGQVAMWPGMGLSASAAAAYAHPGAPASAGAMPMGGYLPAETGLHGTGAVPGGVLAGGDDKGARGSTAAFRPAPPAPAAFPHGHRAPVPHAVRHDTGSAYGRGAGAYSGAALHGAGGAAAHSGSAGDARPMERGDRAFGMATAPTARSSGEFHDSGPRYAPGAVYRADASMHALHAASRPELSSAGGHAMLRADATAAAPLHAAPPPGVAMLRPGGLGHFPDGDAGARSMHGSYTHGVVPSPIRSVAMSDGRARDAPGLNAYGGSIPQVRHGTHPAQVHGFGDSRAHEGFTPGALPPSSAGGSLEFHDGGFGYGYGHHAATFGGEPPGFAPSRPALAAPSHVSVHGPLSGVSTPSDARHWGGDHEMHATVGDHSSSQQLSSLVGGVPSFEAMNGDQPLRGVGIGVGGMAGLGAAGGASTSRTFSTAFELPGSAVAAGDSRVALNGGPVGHLVEPSAVTLGGIQRGVALGSGALASDVNEHDVHQGSGGGRIVVEGGSVSASSSRPATSRAEGAPTALPEKSPVVDGASSPARARPSGRDAKGPPRSPLDTREGRSTDARVGDGRAPSNLHRGTRTSTMAPREGSNGADGPHTQTGNEAASVAAPRQTPAAPWANAAASVRVVGYGASTAETSVTATRTVASGGRRGTATAPATQGHAARSRRVGQRTERAGEPGAPGGSRGQDGQGGRRGGAKPARDQGARASQQRKPGGRERGGARVAQGRGAPAPAAGRGGRAPPGAKSSGRAGGGAGARGAGAPRDAAKPAAATSQGRPGHRDVEAPSKQPGAPKAAASTAEGAPPPEGISPGGLRPSFVGEISLFVGNLPWSTTQEELQERFNKYGPGVTYCHLEIGRKGKSRGWGIVKVNSRELARAIISDQHMLGVAGRHIVVREDARDDRPGAGSRDRR